MKREVEPQLQLHRSDLGRIVAWSAGVVVAVLALMWIFQGSNFFLYKTFAPKEEAVRRETFEQSKAYNQGMIQELSNMMFEYIKADPLHQKALASIILHRAADYDETKLPPDLKQFIDQLRRERTRPEGTLK